VGAGIRTVKIDTSLLDAGGRVRVALIQALPPTFTSDDLDPPRLALGPLLDVIAALRDDDGPTLIVAPELALGRAFAQVDEALIARQSAVVVVVVAGLGFCAPDELPEWFGAGWAPEARANVGGVWVWDRGVVRREGFVKNHFEQQVEKNLLEQAHIAATVLRLDFADVSVFPLICADLIADGPDAPRWRIMGDLAAAPAVRGRAMVVAPLLTHGPGHPLWVSALARWSTVPAEHVRVVTCNHAAPTPHSVETDRFRRLTGVWWPTADHAAEQQPSYHARGWDSALLTGRVVRRVEPTVVAGRLHFEHGSTQRGRAPWSPDRAIPLDENKLVDPWVYEVDRVLGHPDSFVEQANAERARRVAAGFTEGVAASASAGWPDGDRDESGVRAAAASLASLVAAGAVVALDDDPAPIAHAGVGLLVWCDAKRTGFGVGREVANWSRRTGGRPLVLFTDPPVLDATLTRPAITDPAPRGSRITEPRPRAFRVVPLAALEDCRDADDPVGAARALLSTCLAELGRSDPPGSEESPG
jgi:hypothetical protein